jgi:hypothetical protein
MTQERWVIPREGHRWTREEFERRFDETRPAIAFSDASITSESQRYVLLALILQDLGIDAVVRFGNLADWKAAISDLEQQKNNS